jgi:predicted TIM-barrel fold metal-dependent hydrolase
MSSQGDLVVDAVAHCYNRTPENCLGEIAENWAAESYGLAEKMSPPGYPIPEDVYRMDQQPEDLARLMFLESDVDYTVYHGTPIYHFFEDGLTSTEKGARMREVAPERVALYGDVDPLADDWETRMEYLVKELDVDGIKMYPADFRERETIPLQLDGKARPVVEKAAEMDVNTVAVHKSIPIGPLSRTAFDPADVDDIATAFPNLNFEIVHVGFSFLEDAVQIIGGNSNVWGNFEVTTNLMILQPRKFAKILGELLYWVGPDRLMFASGAAFTHPQPLIEAFRDFQIPKDMREEYGYPKVTDEMKAKIFGLNTLELLGKDPDEVQRNIENDRWAEKKAALDQRPKPWSSMERSLPEA